jgi:hypothetical protein
MGEPSRFEVGPQRNRWVAVALSIVMPGSGRLYLGRYHRVAIWLWPTVVFAILVFISSRTGISSLAGAATTAEALGGLLVVSILVALWRLAAAVAAFLIVGPRSGGGAHGLTSGACWKHGGAVEGSASRTFLSLAPHLLAAAASLDSNDIETIGPVRGYRGPDRDGLVGPVAKVSRVRSKDQRVIGGHGDSSGEPATSECYA